MSRASFALAVAVAVAIGACSNAYSGDDSRPDAGTTPSAASCDALDFQRALIVVPEGEPCPEGAAERLLVTGGEAGPGACTCGACTTTTARSCAATGSVVLTYSTVAGCDGAGGTNSYVVNADNGCFAANATFNISPFNAWTSRTPSAGACTAPGVADPSKVTTTKLRTCAPSSQAVVCSALTARRRLCTEALGGGCGGDFPLAVSAGDRFDVACAPCGCQLPAGRCVVEYHGNSTCTNLKFTSELDGMCKATNGANNVSHFKVYPSAEDCSLTPGAATATLVASKQYCCTP